MPFYDDEFLLLSRRGSVRPSGSAGSGSPRAAVARADRERVARAVRRPRSPSGSRYRALLTGVARTLASPIRAAGREGTVREPHRD